MVQPENIKVAVDSTRTLSDSLGKIDSIAIADSLRMVDSLKTVIKIPSGFIGIPHPSLPQTESWVFAILVLLFFLLVYSVRQSIGLISDNIKTFFQVKERSSIFSKVTVNDTRFRFFLVLFSIGVLSFYACVVHHNPGSPLLITEYGLFLLATCVFFGIKYLVFDLTGYIFLNQGSLKMAKEAYFNIVSFLGVVLFPLLFLHIYTSDNFTGTTDTITLIICIIACILVIIKLFQIFFQKVLASFYILLYLCTLEFLPLIILFKVYKLIS
jgi:hypothetical protein